MQPRGSRPQNVVPTLIRERNFSRGKSFKHSLRLTKVNNTQVWNSTKFSSPLRQTVRPNWLCNETNERADCFTFPGPHHVFLRSIASFGEGACQTGYALDGQESG